jgi:hypothetical protein
MASVFFWLFFAFGILEVFFAITVVNLTETNKPETVQSTPWLALVQLIIIAAILFGLVELYEGSILGVIIPMVLSVGCIVTLSIYFAKRRNRDLDPIPLISKFLFLCFFLISIAILVLWIIEIIMTVPWIGEDICNLCNPQY